MHAQKQDLQAFLDRPYVATLASIHPDGFPHVVPVWYEYRDGQFLISTNRDTVKVRNLQRVPKAALSVATHDVPYGYVIAEGEVEITPDDDVDLLERIAIRYLGAEQGRVYAASMAHRPRSRMLLRPRKIRFRENV